MFHQPLDTFGGTWRTPLSHLVAAAALSSTGYIDNSRYDYCQDSKAETYDDITSHLTNMTQLQPEKSNSTLP